MTTEPEHASVLLDCGAQAQRERRIRVAGAVKEWAGQAIRVEAVERRLEIVVKTSRSNREGHREYEVLKGVDLFALWEAALTTEEARKGLAEATEASVAEEAVRRREAVRQAKAGLETVREAYEKVLDAAKVAHQKRVDSDFAVFNAAAGGQEGAQKGCLYGFGAGCSVMATYIAVGIVLGEGGIVGQLGPAVTGVAAIPVAAAIFAQVASALKRSAALTAANQRHMEADQELERVRESIEGNYGAALVERRRALAEAEERLGAYEKLIATNFLRSA